MMKVQSPRDHRRARMLVGDSSRVGVVSRSSEISSINTYLCSVYIYGYKIIFLALPIIADVQVIFAAKTNDYLLSQDKNDYKAR